MHVANVGAIVEHMGGERMSQIVGSDLTEAGAKGGFLENFGDAGAC